MIAFEASEAALIGRKGLTRSRADHKLIGPDRKVERMGMTRAELTIKAYPPHDGLEEEMMFTLKQEATR